MSNVQANILFVDDEINILKGLRRGLRAQREHWNMHFAHGPMEALRLLDESDMDVVVSDMRMPGMNGGDFLEHVRKVSPQTARIILSGYCEENSILKTIGAAHQFLAKPCDFMELEETLRRILGLINDFNHIDLRTFIGAQSNLPTLPDTYMALCQELEKPDANSTSIAKIVVHDLGLETQILKVCNSAFFGLPQKVPDLSTAISLLGVNTIKSMALVQGLFEGFCGSTELKKIIKRLCENSIQLGELSGFFAKQAGFTHDEIAFAKSAGFLSHVGTLILASGCPDMFLHACKLAEEHDKPIAYFEEKLFKTNHAMVGSYFLGLWGFQLPLYEAVAYHHNPSQAPSTESHVLAALHLAQGVAGYDPHFPDKNAHQLNSSFLEAHNLPPSRQDAFELLQQKMKEVV